MFTYANIVNLTQLSIRIIAYESYNVNRQSSLKV